MRITEISGWVVSVPLKREIRHASHSRRDSENVIIRCVIDDQFVGFGEGVPRPYVTGETATMNMSQLQSMPLDRLWDEACSGWSTAAEMIQSLPWPRSNDDLRGCRSNSLRCALELAILDAVGRVLGEPLHRVVDAVATDSSIVGRPQNVRYSTTITSESISRARVSAIKMRAYGFRHCKVKVGVGGDDDPAKLRMIRRWLGSHTDIRVDANEAWSVDEAAGRIAALQPVGISCVEQPLKHADWDALADLRSEVGTAIMLDESFTGEVDARRAIDSGACDLFNIRLSKCGGFLSSLRLATIAKSSGLGFQLGCHPGETPILSAAGRHFASRVREIRYLEGSYDRHLLADAFAAPDITFGYGGRAQFIDRPGLGIQVDEAALRRHGRRVVLRTPGDSPPTDVTGEPT